MKIAAMTGRQKEASSESANTPLDRGVTIKIVNQRTGVPISEHAVPPLPRLRQLSNEPSQVSSFRGFVDGQNDNLQLEDILECNTEINLAKSDSEMSLPYIQSYDVGLTPKLVDVGTQNNKTTTVVNKIKKLQQASVQTLNNGSGGNKENES